MSEERSRVSFGLRVAFVFFATLAILVSVPAFALATGYFHSFYIPSEAMEPTLKVNDRFVAKMGVPERINRGDIVLVAVGEHVYVKRIAALSGDTIELVDGIIHLNGQAIPQRRLGVDRIAQPVPGPYGDSATRLAEQFPGESQAHQIYDMGASAADDHPPTRIPQGHVFVLGDNRDNSADSRVSRADMGVGGPIPITDIRGRPWWYYGLVQADGTTRPTPR